MSRQDRKKRQKKIREVSREVDARGLDAEPNLIHIAAATHKLQGFPQGAGNTVRTGFILRLIMNAR